MSQKAKVGTTLCWNPDCGETVVVKRAEKGGISYSCQHCGFTPFFRVGEPCTTTILKAAEGSKPPEKIEATPATQQPKKQASAGFDMNNL
jgi:hypothetical protein